MKTSKDKSECKNKITSLRLTEAQHEMISKLAVKKNMTMSNYIITTAVNGERKADPAFMVSLQNIINDACAAVNEFAPEKSEELQRKVDALWRKL